MFSEFCPENSKAVKDILKYYHFFLISSMSERGDSCLRSGGNYIRLIHSNKNGFNRNIPPNVLT